MGRRSTTGGVKPAGDRIEIRFTWQGKDLRPTIPLKPTQANLKHAARQRADILEEIKAGTFQLERHFPGYKFADRHAPVDGERARTFSAWADVWEKLARRELEHSTITIYRNHLDHYWMPVLGNLRPAQISHERIMLRLSDLAAEKLDQATGKTVPGIARKTQNNILIPLRAVFALACKDGSPNPAEGIDCLRVQTGNPDPFTASEVELILAELRKPRGRATQEQADAVADYFEFAFFAGMRPSEQIAVLWADVDLRTHTVAVQRARVLKQEKDRTKTHRARLVELNARAAAVIERQRARTQIANGKVFLDPFTGKAWNNGERQRREWMDSVRRAGVRHRPPKECRDTSVTLALSAGADPYWVAAQHGHSVTTMMKDYAKWIPRADGGRNLKAVNAAISEPGEKRFRGRTAVGGAGPEALPSEN